MTKTQDEALVALVRLLRNAKGPAAEAAMLLIDAVRRGDQEEQKERTEDLLRYV